jgi:hypothetical protein
MLIGFWVAGKVSDMYLIAEGGHNWAGIWTFPAIFALGVMLLFMIFFKNETIEYKES